MISDDRSEASARPPVLDSHYTAAPILDRGDRLSYVDVDVPWWCQVSAEQVDELTDLLCTSGMSAVHNELATIDGYLATYVSDQSRGTAIAALLAAGGAPHTLVDLGPGWGAPAEALARLSTSYVGLDTNEHTLRFVRERIRGIAGDQTFIRCGSFGAFQLPLADQSVDAVVANGVLEWVGATGSTPARAMQERFLTDIRRTLTPDGRLLVGIENRWGLQYFLGARDHPGTRFTSLMPRAAADHVLRRRRGSGYWELTHSIRKLKALIADCGFEVEAVHWAQPSYRESRLVVPITDAHMTRASLRFVAPMSLAAADTRQRASAALSLGVRAAPWLRAVVPNVFVTARPR